MDVMAYVWENISICRDLVTGPKVKKKHMWDTRKREDTIKIDLK
jgi:hypothetical protein